VNDQVTGRLSSRIWKPAESDVIILLKPIRHCLFVHRGANGRKDSRRLDRRGSQTIAECARAPYGATLEPADDLVLSEVELCFLPPFACRR